MRLFAPAKFDRREEKIAASYFALWKCVAGVEGCTDRIVFLFKKKVKIIRLANCVYGPLLRNRKHISGTHQKQSKANLQRFSPGLRCCGLTGASVRWSTRASRTYAKFVLMLVVHAIVLHMTHIIAAHALFARTLGVQVLVVHQTSNHLKQAPQAAASRR